MKNHYLTLAFSILAFATVVHAQEPADTVASTSTRGHFVMGTALEDKVFGDVRNQLHGVIPGLVVVEKQGGLYNTNVYETFVINDQQITVKYRGRDDLTFMLDGIIVPYNNYTLDLSQVESISLVSDLVDKARIGPLASNGMIVVRTKEGGYNQPMTVRVNAEAGLSMTDIVPEYADGVDYALLNNQARANAGYSQLYSPIAIDGYLRNDPYDLKYPNTDYRSLMIGNLMPVGNASVSVTGGGASTKYSMTLSEVYSGDIVKTNQPHDFNRINVSSRVTSKLNSFITLHAGFNAMLSFRRRARSNWNDWQKVPPIAYPVILKAKETDGEYAGMTIYGTTAEWPENYYALFTEDGYYSQRSRSAMIQTALDMDFGRWIPGLKSVTTFGYSSFMGTTLSKNNDYLSYYWDPDAEDGMGVISPSHQGSRSASRGINADGADQMLQLREDLTWDRSFHGHNIDLGASFLLFDASMSGVGYYRRIAQGIGTAKYNFRNRYIVEGVLQYTGSSRFNRENRFKPFLSGGVAWIASNEDFLKDVSWIDYLRLRGQFGSMGKYSSAFGTNYLYESRYSQSNGYTYGPSLVHTTWFGTSTYVSQRSSISRLANPLLGWESIQDWLVGLDFDFCNGFSLNLTAYSSLEQGEIGDISSVIPTIYGLSSVTLYGNYAEHRITGYEASLGYRRTFGDFTFNTNASLFNWDKIYAKMLSDDSPYEYLRKTGTSHMNIWGLKCIGRYTTQEEVETIPSYGTVQIGDLMYDDRNGDGTIDALDYYILGNTRPKVQYSLNIGLKYRNLEFQVYGSGVAGNDIVNNDSYFWSGWGNGNYSAFVRDNIGGDYPRLSYVKSANNFVTSDFWIRDGSWFKIQEASLTYDIPLKSDKIFKGLKVSLKGQNLARFTSYQYLDPESSTAGVSGYPLFRTVTAGARIVF